MHWGVDDQSIQELEDKLFSQILLAQRQFNAICGANPALASQSKSITQQLKDLRGCNIELPSLFSGQGHGPFAQMIDGSVKFDLIGGIGPYLLGHSHPLQIRANLKAARGSILSSTNFLPASISTQTAKTLIDAARPSKLEHCWFSGSGSMANDSALRLIANKRCGRKRLIAFENSFAGRSISMQSITSGKETTESMSIDFIPFPIDEESGLKAKKVLSNLFDKHGDDFAVFYGELIQGEAGVLLPHRESLKQLFASLKQKDIPVWVDEVQTFGRTTELFAFQFFEVSEFVDICTIGKAFNLSAVLYRSDFALEEGLGGTFQGSISALIYAHDLLRLLVHGPIYGPKGRASALEMKIRNMFEQVALDLDKPELLSDLRGLGTMWGVTPGKGKLKETQQFLADLYDNGVIAWRAGRNKHCIRLLFPLTLTDEHFSRIQSIFIHCLNKAKYLES